MTSRLVSPAVAGAVLVGNLLAFGAHCLAGDPTHAGISNHWAFQSVQRPTVPTVRDQTWMRTPIDAYILAALDRKRLTPAPAADRRTLLRRVYLDLIGLPPTPEEQLAFLEDPSAGAYARVVDDLLSRPQHGERWARHWLDVVRYAESNGYERDGAKPSAWRYRDYVIDSFNRDKPYDRFVQEQIAGDELDGSNAETQLATTFLRLGTWDDEPADPKVDRYDQLDDVLGTTATAFLGLTLRCARCHDHKFEPFTQKDYYGMLAVFEPLRRPEHIVSATHRMEYELPVGTVRELQAFHLATARQVSVLAGALGPGLGGQSRIVALPGLAVMHQIRPRDAPQAYICYEGGLRAPVTRIFRRGDPTKPAGEVGPGLPAVLVGPAVDPPRPTSHSTGRRLWLAHWLTRPDNPLLARVMVNRVWQHHFGKGLVASANDFGTMGDRPTHPELLDWLAAEFVASGWRLKTLHRMIVLSNVYQTAADRAVAKADPRGVLFAGWRPRRLEAEAVRDSVLAVSGRLNPQQGGPSVYPTLPRAVLEGQSVPGDGWGKSDEKQAARRSVYLFVKRSLGVPELELLDAPDTTSSCEQRPISTTAPQALTFLNGDFMRQQAERFARRLEREAGDDALEQVRQAFALAVCRPPRERELRAAIEFLRRQRAQIERDLPAVRSEAGRRKALEAFCLVLLNTNEFAYVD